MLGAAGFPGTFLAPLTHPAPAFVPAEPQYFRFEGVWLTETGMAVLRNLSMSPLHKRRQRKGRLGTLNGEGGLEGGDPLGPDDKKDGDLDADELLKAEGAFSGRGRAGERVFFFLGGHPADAAPLSAVGVEHMECEIKLEALASPDRDVGADVDSGKGLEDPDECKKRKRKPYRPGERCPQPLPPQPGCPGAAVTPPSPPVLPPPRHRRLHGATAQVPHAPEEGPSGAG